MTSQRAKDRLIGAAAVIVVLVLAAGMLWWAVTRPADDGAALPVPTRQAPGGPAGTPPAGLDEDELWLGELTLDASAVLTAGASFRDVHAVGSDVLTAADGLVAGELTVDATVPFEVVAEELGAGTVVSAAQDGQARVVREVRVLGRELDVTAVGTVEVEGGRLVVEPTSIDIGGPEVLADVLGTVVRRLVTIEHELEGLPPGLVLRSISVQDDGFRAHLAGWDVTLVP